VRQAQRSAVRKHCSTKVRDPLLWNDRQAAVNSTLFENAGHSSPIVLRGDEATFLTEGGTVLGLFPKSVYEERQFALRPGDCLLLTTDGVMEAANERDEEFCNGRVIASARAARSLGAEGIRSGILDDVTRFCDGNFHDDATLIVVTVD
jgi:sigma-B regulation protein RsbU (phosphoserine phosphatase)